jgi:dihydroorotate dehydrogenase (NAD+) catalytic subunit
LIDLSVSFNSIKLKNPIILASGVWDIPYSEIIDFNKLGGIVYKGVSLKKRLGNPVPRITETPCGAINSIGLANEGIENFNKEVLPRLKDFNTAIFINIFGETIEEFSRISEKVRDVNGIEVNISCPNVKKGGIFFGINPETAYNVTEAVYKNTDLPVIVKLTPAASNIIEIAKACKDAGASVLTACNTFQGLVIDIENKKPLFKKIVGGVSGPAIKPLALYRVYQICKDLDIPIIGSGGIINYKDVIEYMIAGARAIQLGSVIFNNPLAPMEIIDNIVRYLKDNGYNKIEDVRKFNYEKRS